MKTTSMHSVLGFVRRLAELGDDTPTDRDLLARFTCDRDEAAFTEIVRRHGPMVWSTCRRVLVREQDVEDAFQAAFLVLGRKAATIRQEDSVGCWLHQVAHRLALRLLSKNQRERQRLNELLEGVQTPRGMTAEDEASLRDELQRLPESYRAVVVLCYSEGRTQTEAARLLGTTPDAVNSRLKRARQMLRQRYRAGLIGTGSTAGVLCGSARGAPPALVEAAARNAVSFAAGALAGNASARTIALAQGALTTMSNPLFKIALAGIVAAALLTAGVLFAPPALGDRPTAPAPEQRKSGTEADRPEPQPADKKKTARQCIILWMSGGPSQIDTFDPKPGNIALFPAIDTSVKGLQFSRPFPLLAKQAKHLAVIRTLSHRDGDHMRATYLMRTGYVPSKEISHPEVGSVLGKELERADRPRYVRISPSAITTRVISPGFLGEEFGGLMVGEDRAFGAQQPSLTCPPAADFEALAKGQGEAHRKAVLKAFDLNEENDKVRDAYGRNRFGEGCLLARRLIDRGVPVIEVTLGGWDTHANAAAATPPLAAKLDAGFSALLSDLHASGKLESTLIVCMGEFGRTPRVNAQGGRDHWPMSFSVVLAGCGIKGGQAIGKTSADATKIEERPVTPPELLATIYHALGVDFTKENVGPGVRARLVERGATVVKEMLR